ncbi:ATP synthase F1 subunit epsilon [bacterium]|nr:ATP synthase F1 subunit epsilon [bacterium]
MSKLHLKITTNEKVIFDNDVKEIYLKGTQGEFGILPNHIPFMTPLEIGITKVVTDDGVKLFTTMGGIFQLKDNEALILTQTAEDANEIDVQRATEARERALARLAEDGSDLVDYRRAEIALARAMARLKASDKNI